MSPVKQSGHGSIDLTRRFVDPSAPEPPDSVTTDTIGTTTVRHVVIAGDVACRKAGTSAADGSACRPARPWRRVRRSNRYRIHRWSTKVTVVDAVSAEVLRFRVDFLRIPISEWVYEFQPTLDGCRVTESWTDRRPGWFKPVARLATGVGDRAERTRDGIALTLTASP